MKKQIIIYIGILLIIDEPTRNHRIYTRECVEKIVDDFNNEKNDTLIYANKYIDTESNDIRGGITEMWIEGNELKYKAQLIKRDYILDMLESNQLCVSPIAQGNCTLDKNGNIIVDTNTYKLLATTILPINDSAVHGKDNKK